MGRMSESSRRSSSDKILGTPAKSLSLEIGICQIRESMRSVREGE